MDDAGRPLVSCLCPTYGRFALLRQSLACFLAQDYEPKELVILNDHPQAIECHSPGVRVVNSEMRYEGMGRKRQALLELARGEWACQWDDDDFYLPWHISHWLPILMASGKKLLKVNKAFSSRGVGTQYRVVSLSGNAYQSQYIFEAEAARQVGYGDWWIVEAREFGKEFFKRGWVHRVAEDTWASMIYGWGNNTAHGSARGESKKTWDFYGRFNKDVGTKLTPGPIGHQLREYYRFVTQELDAKQFTEPLAIVKRIVKC